MWQATKNVWHLAEVAAAHAFYGFPAKSLELIGVTGTDGKTTTVSLLAHILTQAGKRTSSISSVAAVINGKSYDTGAHTTTPYRFGLPRYLQMMHKEKSEYGVLEITSHALDQHRAFGLRFAVSVITNVTREHLDYHRTFEKYLATKARIIRQSAVVVLNRDDQSYAALASLAKKAKVSLVTFGITDSPDVTARDITLTASSSRFSILLAGVEKTVTTHLVGSFNLFNILAAAGAASVFDISLPTIVKAVENFPGVPGRMQVVDEGQRFATIIDFAHTPNALEQVLKLIGSLTNGRVIVVFGAAGERDRGKRPVMGAVAQKFADLVVLTAEDPRSENVAAINAAIAQGCLTAGGSLNKTFWMIPDRREAIRFAILRLAKPADTLVVAGKGPEKTLTIGNVDMPWSDEAVAREALKMHLQERQGL